MGMGLHLASAALWLVGVVGTATAAPAALPGSACGSPPVPATLVRVTVRQVVDGDTIRVRGPRGAELVRLIGIDAPEVYNGERLEAAARRAGRSAAEIRAQGLRSAAFARRVLVRREVGLEFDVQRHDRFGRTLAYVWLSDGTMFNWLILREGYAQVLTIPPNVRYAALFVACQREARAAMRGLWARE